MLFAEVAPRFADRPGGYTRIVKLGPRQGTRPRWRTSSSWTTCRRALRRRAPRSPPSPRKHAVAPALACRGCPRSGSRSSTTAPAFAAGRRSRGCGRSRARSRQALGRVFPAWVGACGRRTDRRRRARAREVASVERGRRPAARTARRGAERRASRPTSRSCRREEAAPDFHARHAAVSRAYRYRVYRRREPSPFEERRSWWYPRPLDEEALAESADAAGGRARLPGLHARPRRSTRSSPRREERSLAPARRRPRARDRGGQLPPAHGSHARRDDGRATAGGARAAPDWGPRPGGRRQYSAPVGSVPRTRPVLTHIRHDLRVPASQVRGTVPRAPAGDAS